VKSRRAKKVGHLGDRVDRWGALNPERTSDVLSVHDDLAEPCWDVTRGRSGAVNDSPESLERLARAVSSVLSHAPLVV